MALIPCPECGNPVSDQAESCPKCGFPIPGDAAASSKPPLPGDPDQVVRTVLLEQGKIAAIKRYRELKPGFGLRDAKEHVERLEAQLPPGQRGARKGVGCLVLIILVVAAGMLGTWLGG